ncbi:MAG: transglutaminase domain-containing protein [Planctomycetota bacterium]|nr:transglutaminase domain-containing protein [Planctomycetota bacterium]
MSVKTKAPKQDIKLSLLGGLSLFFGYVSLANSLYVEAIWGLAFLAAMGAHWLKWQPLKTTFWRLFSYLFVGAIALALDNLIGEDVRESAVLSPFLTRRATYFLAYMAAFLPVVLAFQARSLLIHRNLAALGGAMIMLSGNVGGHHKRVEYFHPIMMCFAVVFVLWLTELSRQSYPQFRMTKKHVKRYRGWLAFFVISLLGLTVAGAQGVEYFQREYGVSLARLMRSGANGGFIDQTRIGRFRRNIQSRSVVLWYKPESSQGIVNLVGKRFQTYEFGGMWFAKPMKRVLIDPWPGDPPFTPKSQSDFLWAKHVGADIVGPMPSLDTAARDKLRHDRVLVVSQKAGTLFLPLRSRALAISNSKIYFSRTGTASLNRAVSAQEYGVLVGDELAGRGHPAMLTPQDRERLTNVPDELRDKFKALALKITASGKTPQAKALLVEQWFHKNYGYTLEFDKDPKFKDPIEDFLTNKKDAWCEFFAAGMALLLRSIDIPTRYVAGYVCHDIDRSNNTYTVRGSDGHAWVEAYFDEKGWATYDPTPPAGRQENELHSQANIIEKISAAIWKFLMEFYVRSQEFSVKEFLLWLFSQIGYGLLWFFRTPLRAIFSSLTLILLFGLAYRRRRAARMVSGTRLRTEFSPDSFASHELQFKAVLAEFDRKLEENGWSRPSQMTPIEIAEHLEKSKVQGMSEDLARSLGAFARKYSELRFRGQAPNAEDIARLTALLNESPSETASALT